MEYINKDIFKAFDNKEFDILIHQTNCFSGADVHGIAKTVFEKYPQVLKAHLLNAKFGLYSNATVNDENVERRVRGVVQMVINANAQFYPGAPKGEIFRQHHIDYCIADDFDNRIIALKKCLKFVSHNKLIRFGVPLIASGEAADPKKKGDMSDLDYFKTYIAPEIDGILTNLTVYYL